NVAEGARLRARARKETGRPKIPAKITAAELQEIVENWADGDYAQRVHSTTREKPLARMLACTAPRRAVPDADTLLIAMSAAIGPAVVTKRGITWKGDRYWHHALNGRVGERVQLRRDEGNLGEIFVLDADDKFICTATNHLRAGVSEADFATAARRKQKQWEAEQRAELRELKKTNNMSHITAGIRRSDAIAAGRVVELPRAAEPHSTPTLASIGPATPAAPAPDWQRIEADRAARHAKSAPTPIDRGDQIRRADAAIAAAARGEEVPNIKWARLFVKSSTYLTAKAMAAARAKGAKA
ncbi:MAG TPA: Mu transposase C-terminal domain-containing protein, partial [Polymorphobacter sp.]|nr:Mu transposase C-terminal domain-containing protein [Polymorphobacter sp.]